MDAKELAEQLAHEAELSTTELLARLAVRGGTDCRAAAMRIQQQDETIRLLEAELARLRDATRWRSVRQEYPETGKHVFVASKPEGWMCKGFRNATGKWWYFDDTLAIHPTHWQPLPEPPK